ncbi:YopX family protein [Prevotellamassilia timonensis]|uniref:YopX family protein n=1 Tax=Prevotellamassilia timonensis TaxID=1852370 RepID=UPI0023F1FDBC|nr:YopX family protein [Prevotellamassilia timonensis]MDD7439756.1 YopX family protein [Prevotellamassilia timonensis]
MREILFRGKRFDSGEWVYGTMYKIAIDLNPFILTGGKRGCSYQVDGETVGQYTGLIDKNGVKIFEGDIVDLFGMKGKVVQECGAFGIAFMKTIDYDLLESKMPFNNSANFCFNDNFISLWEVFWNYEQGDNTLYYVEVIGNANGNPELLEK